MVTINTPKREVKGPQALDHGDCIRVTKNGNERYYFLAQVGEAMLAFFSVDELDFNRMTDPVKYDSTILNTDNILSLLPTSSSLFGGTCEKVKFNLTIDILG